MHNTKSLVQVLHRASQIAEAEFMAAIGDVEMTARQAVLLAAISECGAASQAVLVTHTGVDRSTASDLLKRLAKRGLVTRRRSKDDARAYVVKLTEAGEAALRRARPALDAVDRSLLDRVGKRHASGLIELLDAMARVPTST